MRPSCAFAAPTEPSRSRRTATAGTCTSIPREGARIAVAEAARNVACAGARPMAITNNLNFGNPKRPEVYFQLREAVAGMGEACAALGTPVTGGNVSLYNENPARRRLSDAGRSAWSVLVDSIGAHHALHIQHTRRRDRPAGRQHGRAGRQRVPRARARQVAGRLRAAISRQSARSWRRCSRPSARASVRSAHDCADGGLAVALAECVHDGSGASDQREDRPARHGRALPLRALLFGEAQGRVIVSTPDAGCGARHRCATRRAGARRSGRSPRRRRPFVITVGSTRIQSSVAPLADAYHEAIPSIMSPRARRRRTLRSPPTRRSRSSCAAYSVFGVSPRR